MNSRHEFAAVIVADGVRRLADRTPVRFRTLPDTAVHTVVEGDTLWHLAHASWVGKTDRPAGLWWVLADFQPVPIVDPTLELRVGSLVYIPPWRFVVEEVLNPRRRRTS